MTTAVNMDRVSLSALLSAMRTHKENSRTKPPKLTMKNLITTDQSTGEVLRPPGNGLIPDILQATQAMCVPATDRVLVHQSEKLTLASDSTARNAIRINPRNGM